MCLECVLLDAAPPIPLPVTDFAYPINLIENTTKEQ
jgi:hypothetical protein